MTAWRFSGATGDLLWGPQSLPGVHRDNQGAPTVFALSSNGNLIQCAEDQTSAKLVILERDGSSGSLAWGPKLPDPAAKASATLVDLAAGAGASNRVAVIGNIKPGLDEQPTVATLVYDRTAGTISWGPKVLGPAGTSYSATQAAVDGAGNVIVTVSKDYPKPSGAAVVKYSGLDGSVIWGPAVVTGVQPFRAALDAAGNAMLLGSSNGKVVVVKLAAGSGAILWGPVAVSAGQDGLGFPDSPSGIAIDVNGNVVAVGTESHVFAGLHRDWTVSKLSGSTGAFLWGPVIQDDPQEDVGANAVAIDKFGDVIVTGGWAMLTVKYSGASGARAWSFNPGGESVGASLAVEDGGDIFVAGFTASGVTVQDVIAVRLKGSDGTILWGPSQFDGPGKSWDYPYWRGSGLDADGNFVVAGIMRLEYGSRHPHPAPSWCLTRRGWSPPNPWPRLCGMWRRPGPSWSSSAMPPSSNHSGRRPFPLDCRAGRPVGTHPNYPPAERVATADRRAVLAGQAGRR